MAIFTAPARHGGAYREGRRRAIWVSIFHPDRLMDPMIHNQVAPAVNQIETNPFCQQIETQKVLGGKQGSDRILGPLAEGKNYMFQNDLLLSLAEKYPKTVAQIILRWFI